MTPTGTSSIGARGVLSPETFGFLKLRRSTNGQSQETQRLIGLELIPDWSYPASYGLDAFTRSAHSVESYVILGS